MRLQKSKSRQRSSNHEASFDEDILSELAASVGDEDNNDVSSLDGSSPCVTSSLLRKVKRRHELSPTDLEIVRLIGQGSILQTPFRPKSFSD
jgi:hypothetical protein